MRIKPLRFAAAAGSLLMIFSCVTINIYFPEATVKKTAEEIVDEVRKKDEKQKDKQVKEEVLGHSSEQNSLSLVPAAYAQEETTVSSPKIRALKDSLRERFSQLKSFYDKGNIGEGNDGFIQVREEADLSLMDKATLRNLVKDENNDRQNLYEEVGRALNIDPSQIPRIQKIFAESWIRSAELGWWIQKEDGEWTKKT